MTIPDILMSTERQDRITARLAADGRVVALDLAREFDVSEDTIRRDLRELAKAGLCRRVYGGALSPSPATGSLAERQTRTSDGKTAIAKAAAALVTQDQVIFIDAGSTNVLIAQNLPRDLNLTVVTNAPAVALALADRRDLDVIMIGGAYNTRQGCCLGTAATAEAAKVRADLFFLGTCGVDAVAGITAYHGEEGAFKAHVARNSARVIVVATAEKLSTAAPFEVLPIGAVDTLVVEADTAPQRLAEIEAAGVRILRAAQL